MKINKKLYSVALVSVVLVLFLILVSSTASASIIKTKLTNNVLTADPVIYGNKIVWTETQNGSNIYLFDLSTKKKTQITTSGSAYSPDIYDNKIVWQDTQNDTSNIYMYDLSTKKKTQITTSGTAYYPSIYGNNIIWDDDRNYDDNKYSIDPLYDVYAYDISTKKETEIATLNLSCDIYGNKVVMLRSIGDGPISDNNVYVYDLSNKKATQITTDGYNGGPAIYGNKIVWTHYIDDMAYSKIYMYDLSTKKKTRISTSNIGCNAHIYGNNIVWLDNRNGNWDIYAFDLITKQETHTTDKTDHDQPAIYGNTIVWTDFPSEKPSVYMGTISYFPVAAFTASPTSGKYPLDVKFTDKSTDARYWSWNFGDKSTSTARNPTHKYTKAGKYKVSLTVKNAAGSNTTTKKNYITVTTPVKPVAAFSAKPTSGNAPLKVQFTDKSTGSPTSWKWSFGDGTYSTSKSPSHTYKKAGKYTVSLTVKNAAGANTKTIKNYIVAKELKAPVAAFSASPTSGKAPLKVQFTDKSSNSPTSWKWSFGDGTYSTAKSPAHKYGKAGKYTVSLTVKNTKGSNTKTVSNYITVKK